MKILFFCISLLFGCSLLSGIEFKAGDCIQAPDAYVWKISRISGTKYVAEGWQGNGWGNETELAGNVLSSKRGYKAVECPRLK